MYEVNRSVIIVIPTELFWNWLQNLPDTDLSELTLEDLQEDANSYLIPACQNADEVWDEVESRGGRNLCGGIGRLVRRRSRMARFAPRYFPRMV